MLTRLDIRGLAVIDTLGIEFDTGLNVITGETGAGKSILIKALGLLLGAKASPEAVRTGVDRASVAGTFEIPVGHPSIAVLERYGIPVEEEGPSELLIRRTVAGGDRKGSRGSKGWVNDVPVTVSVLREIGASLIDVFGQHESHGLLDVSQHARYVDRFLASQEPVDTVARRFEECSDLWRRLVRMAEDFRSRQRDADYLAFRLEELDGFEPSREDHDAAAALGRRAGGAMKIREAFAEAQGRVDTGAGGEPLSQPLFEASRRLRSVADSVDAAGELADEADEIASRLDDLSYRLAGAASDVDVDERELVRAQDRVAGYQSLFRKLGVAGIDELLAEHERLREELGFLETAAAEAEEVARALVERARALERAAKKLAKARAKAGEKLVARVGGELGDLAMPSAEIHVELEPVRRSLPDADVALFGEVVVTAMEDSAKILEGIGEHGSESARLVFSANPGEEPRPLQKIASGGELSRIVLALKKALSVGADTCVLVFDEIDTGISGRVADVVGRKMHELGGAFQVICISHLAQVASHADAHFQVEKKRKGRRTETVIRRLDGPETEEALARLLSGQEVSKTSLANARALLKKARS